MAIVNIYISNRIASVEAGVELVCNNPTYTIRFIFDEEWNEHEMKTARFSWEGKYIDVPFVGNEVQVPEIYRTHYVFVGVYTDNLTSSCTKVPCRYSIKCLGGKNNPPSEDVYNQIVELINELNQGGVSDEKIAEAVEKYLAENTVYQGEPGIKWCGEWDLNESYSTGDAVFYNGSAYIANEEAEDGAPSGDDPETNSLGIWDLLAKGGEDGTPGTSVTVKSVSESSADGGSNVVTFSDGKTVTIKNGSKGSKGDKGDTPVKGTDYWTEADKAELIELLHDTKTVKYEYAVENVLCIGDSLTEGCCYANGMTGQAILQNYPYYLKRMLNCETTNAGKGGETISGWYATNIVQNKYDFSAYDAIIIWLGTNSPCTAMPSDSEISAFTPVDSPDATTANHALYLCEIIKRIQAENPDCFILLCGIFSPSTKAETHNAVVLQIANKYGAYFVDMADLHNSVKPELHADLDNPHFGKAGNIFIASRISNYIREKIANNPLRAEFGYGDGSGGNIEPDNPEPTGNRVPYSIDTDGNVYNGTGYKDGWRLSSSMVESEKSGMTVTGYIAVSDSDVIRLSGVTWDTSPSNSMIVFYDENFAALGCYGANGYTSYPSNYNGMANACVFQDKSKQSVSIVNGVTKFNLVFNTADQSKEYSSIAASHIAYMRICATGNGANMIVTLNEEIT